MYSQERLEESNDIGIHDATPLFGFLGLFCGEKISTLSSRASGSMCACLFFCFFLALCVMRSRTKKPHYRSPLFVFWVATCKSLCVCACVFGVPRFLPVSPHLLLLARVWSICRVSIFISFDGFPDGTS